jgi:transcription elongation factor SPT6
LLWAVQTLDRKWLLLQKRKVALEMYYEKRFEDEKRRIDDVTRQELNTQLYNSIIVALKDTKSEKEVEDVDAKFNLHFPPGEVEEEGQFKRPKRKSLYSICHKAGLWEVASKFGRSAEQLGHHLTLTKIPVRNYCHFGTLFYLWNNTTPANYALFVSTNSVIFTLYVCLFIPGSR